VRPTAQAMMGGIKRAWDRGNTTLTTDNTGTSTAYTLTYSVAAAAYYNGEEFAFIVDKTCGATPSLNINGLGAQNFRKFSGGAYVALAAGDLVASQPIRVRQNTSATTFDIVSGAADIGAFVPTGLVVPYAGASAPAGYLLCFGQAISRTTFAALFAVCSTTYGAGDGSTTFNVPDLRGYVAAGKDDMGGSAAGRLSGGTTLGAGLGAQTHNHSGSTMDGPNADNLAANGADFFAANVSHVHTLHIASDTNVQPTFILNYIIKT
jgi:microcystin-dependent protein